MLYFKMMCISCLSLICLAACQAGSSTLRANAGQDFSVIVGRLEIGKTLRQIDGVAVRGELRHDRKNRGSEARELAGGGLHDCRRRRIGPPDRGFPF